MKIILNEEKFSSLILCGLFETVNPLKQKVSIDIASLKKLIATDGVLMVNLENGKEYVVYEISSIANVIGKRFCVAQLVKDGELYGSLIVKPLSLFKVKNY